MKISIRKMFHKIGNMHNSMSIMAGFAEELLKNEKLKNLNDPGMVDLLKKVEKSLNDFVNKTLEVDKKIDVLKKYIYVKLDPDEALDIDWEE